MSNNVNIRELTEVASSFACAREYLTTLCYMVTGGVPYGKFRDTTIILINDAHQYASSLAPDMPHSAYLEEMLHNMEREFKEVYNVLYDERDTDVLVDAMDYLNDKISSAIDEVRDIIVFLL